MGVDLVVNCYERTYREVLSPGTFARVAEENRFRFERRTALVNNVDDRPDAEARANRLRDAGELDELFFVEDHLASALERTGLGPGELEPIPHFSDWALVAVGLLGPEWLLQWDAEIHLRQPADWISPALDLMGSDPRILAATPNWPVPGDMERHEVERRGAFSLGYGFSDHVFLARRAELARPIYSERSLSRLRYPLAHVGHIFEARVDAHMRRHGRLRAVHAGVVYEHALEIGVAYPTRTLVQKARYVRNRAVIGALRRSPWRPRSLKGVG